MSGHFQDSWSRYRVAFSKGQSDMVTKKNEIKRIKIGIYHMTGEIDRKIGQLRQLQLLDLSRNNFSSSIPPSTSELTFLGTLDLSYNHLSGKIPTGTQLQSFNSSVFSYNHGICGHPVTPNCSGSVEPPQGQPERSQDDEFKKWFYASMALGFALSFWGFCDAFLLRDSLRYSYFRLLDRENDWLYVTYALQKAWLERKVRP